MDVFTPEKRSEIMSRVRGKDTAPEIVLRKVLWDSGWRYRKHYGPYKIDIAFPRLRVAIFVDGCFWHCCPDHGEIPASNRQYWEPKLRRNSERDAAITNDLTNQGWTVIRVWEHETKGDLRSLLVRIEEALISRSE